MQDGHVFFELTRSGTLISHAPQELRTSLLKAKDCRLDQLLFAGRLMATLAAGEWNPSALPDVLSPFYYLFRPLHMAGRHSGPILRAIARK